jgi:hypothetical protein
MNLKKKSFGKLKAIIIKTKSKIKIISLKNT